VTPTTEPKTVNDTMDAVAIALRDAIRDTPDCVADSPEDVHADLACRFVLRLSRRGVTILPISRTAKEVTRAQEVAQAQEAAQRIFNILTRWLNKHPGCSYTTGTTPSGRFEVRLITPKVTHVFGGLSVQDAWAQAAQAIDFGGAP